VEQVIAVSGAQRGIGVADRVLLNAGNAATLQGWSRRCRRSVSQKGTSPGTFVGGARSTLSVSPREAHEVYAKTVWDLTASVLLGLS
jgi:hypothetical protein